MPVARGDIERALTEVTGPFLAYVTALHASMGGHTEIRVLRERAVWATRIGPEDVDGMVAALMPVRDQPRQKIRSSDYPRSGEGQVYFTLGAVSPDAPGNVGLPLRRASLSAKDADIVASPWVAVDLDPKRVPAGRSATDVEKALARNVADSVMAAFAERGVPSVLADSGNGWHVLVRSVPAVGNDVMPYSRRFKDLLIGLDQRFSTTDTKVDCGIFNPSRILKLYGTVAPKGEDSADAPHRLSTVDAASMPTAVDAMALLGDLAPAPTAPAKDAYAKPGGASRVDGPDSPLFRRWCAQALAALDPATVYGELLTGKAGKSGWLECRDPDSASGDQNPSASVADGTGAAARCAFHSFRTGETESVFKFLVRQGRAADLDGAYSLVADLVGVPIPPDAFPADGAAILDRFHGDLAAACDDTGRAAAVRTAVRVLVRLPAIEFSAHSKAVQAAAGLTASVFRATVAEVRKEAKADRRADPTASIPTVATGRPVVKWFVNGDRVDALFDAIVDAIAPHERFFSTGSEIVYVVLGRGQIGVTDHNIGGFLFDLVELCFMKHTDEGPKLKGFDVLPPTLARAFISSDRVGSRLPRLEMYARSPVFDRSWAFIGVPGYDRKSGIYYDGAAITPTEGVARLHDALEGFHWRDEADRVNFIGALLTLLTMPHWPHGHPFLAVNGNKAGVGKSTLVKVLAMIVEGQTPSAITFDDDDQEFEKQVGTRVDLGDRVIFVDNVKTRRGVESAVLERCITDSRLNFRRLGTNTAISRPGNDILVCLTMNVTQLGADLRRRALPVNLEIAGGVRSTTYTLDDVVAFAQEHRPAILGELAGMVKAWVDSGRKACDRPAQHSACQPWASTMDGILRLAGFDGFLTNFEDSEHAFDPQYQIVFDACRDHHSKPASTAGQWVVWLSEPLGDRFVDRRGQPRSARARQTIVGSLFSGYLDVEFDVDGERYRLVRETPDGPTRSAVYGFSKVGP